MTDNLKKKVTGLKLPETITLAWLFYNVPIKYCGAAVGVICFVFLVGVSASELSIVREIINKPTDVKIENFINQAVTEGEYKTSTTLAAKLIVV
jgi:hypothetical protein